MSRTYNTRHGESLNRIIDETSGHFTAEQICEKMRSSGNAVGLSTVYRHLDRLEKDGKLYKYFSSFGESSCYQKVECPKDHFHLKCVVCGKLEHLSCDHLCTVQEHVLKKHGFKIDPSKTVFFGTCAECGGKNEK